MLVSTTFLGAACVGGALAWNAIRPLARTGRGSVLAYFAAWIIGELPLHHVVLQVAATAVFIRMGALREWPGWVGLAVAVASWGGLVEVFVTARRARAVCEQALIDALGEGYARSLAPRLSNADPRVDACALVFPLARRPHDVECRRDVTYGPFGQLNQLDIYHRRGASLLPQGQPVLIQLHGGGWSVGRKELNGLPLMHHLAARGWICVSINYRLSPRFTFPDHIVDVKRAIAWVKANIADYGGDPGFVALTGGSAGGHLSALAALTPNDPELQPGFEAADTRVQTCVPLYGVYDLTNRSGKGHALLIPLLERRIIKRPLATARGVFESASPVYRVTGDAPPFLVVHGANDTVAPVAEAREFVERLRQASRADVAYIELPEAQHAFDVLASVRTGHVIAAVARFLAYQYRSRAP